MPSTMPPRPAGLRAGLLAVLTLTGTGAALAQPYTVTYTYDAQGRLTSYKQADAYAYSYDAAGNLLTVERMVVLPVELIAFEALVDGEVVVLTWKTARETNSAGFHIQRREGDSGDEDWRAIGFLEGAGTTSRPTAYRFTDALPPPGRGRLAYRLRQVDFDGGFSYSPVVDVDLSVPQTFALHAAYPNPFNPSTTIGFDVKTPVRVRLKVYDVLGREVATLVDAPREAGRYHVAFDAGRLASGVYFYTIEMGGFRAVRTMTLMQ